MPLTFLPPKPSPNVYAEQVRLLYKQGILIQSLGLITAFLAVAAFFPVADHTVLLLWLGAMILVTGIRLLIAYRFKQRNPDRSEIAGWGKTYMAGTFLSGMLWGSLALLFDPAWPAPYQVVLFAIFTGTIAGGFNTNSSVAMAFPVFYLPIVIFAVGITLIQESTSYLLLAAMFIIYMVLMHFSSLTYYRHLTQALTIRFQNEALAAELTESNKTLSHLAERDELTGLFNRRSMNRFLHEAWRQCDNADVPLSLLFIDIDYFKQYNDNYGHTEGDNCLREFASLIEKSLTAIDDATVTRFGGEEFAVILPGQDLQKASEIARTLQKELEKKQIVHDHSAIASCLTMSIGVATTLPSGQIPATSRLLRKADSALYEAKGKGRNCVVALELL